MGGCTFLWCLSRKSLERKMSNVESVPWCGDAGIFFVELLFSDGFGKVAGSKKGVIVVKVVEWLV